MGKNYQTLKEIWNGVDKIPFYAKKNTWQEKFWFYCVGIAPDGFAVGWNSLGNHAIENSSIPEWEEFDVFH